MLFLEKVQDLIFLCLDVLTPDNFIGMLFLLVVSSCPLYLFALIIYNSYALIGGYSSEGTLYKNKKRR